MCELWGTHAGLLRLFTRTWRVQQPLFTMCAPLCMHFLSHTSPSHSSLTRTSATNQGKMGELLPGAAADLLLVDGDPLDDIGVLTAASNIRLVIKHGLLAKVCGYCQCVRVRLVCV